MARKDVELRISAKNDADKALSSVTSALKDLLGVQQDVADTSSKADGALKRLGSAFNNLNNEIKSLTGLRNVSEQVNRLEASMQRLEGELVDAAMAADRTLKSYLQAASVTDSYRRAVEASQKAIERQRTALEGQGKSATAINKALKPLTNGHKELEKNLRSAAAAEETFGKQAEAAAKKVDTARGAYHETNSELSRVRGLAQQAAQSLGVTALSTDAVAERSRNLTGALRQVGEELARQRSVAPDTSVQRTTANYRDLIVRLGEAKRAYQESRAEATRLGAAMASVEQPTAEMVAAFELARARAERTKREFYELGRSLANLRGVSGGTFASFSSQVSQRMAAINAEARRAAGGMQDASRSTMTFSQALRQFVGSSRQAMSIMQRLRAEVLSLVVAYTGIQGTIRQLGGVVQTFQTIEAAQSRLGAVFGQDVRRVGQEIDWLHRQAARLGVQFGTMADEYSKFAVAAQGANFQGSATREIFLRVAEAGRVNKLSLEQMSGVYLALTQMISKGTIQSEELRRQLGDRLPGAFNIMADALGVSTERLGKMMQAGEVLANESTLLKFAAELERRFGPQLLQSLQTFTTEYGKFENEVFGARARVAEGGFIESLKDALKELNQYFRSREGRDFFLSLGAAAGRLVNGLVLVARNLDLISGAAKIFISYKLATLFVGIGRAAAVSVGNITSLAASIRAASTESARMATAFNAAAAGQARFTAAGAVSAIAAIGRAIATIPAALMSAVRGFSLATAASGALTGALSVLRGALTAGALAWRAFWASATLGLSLVVTGVLYALISLFGDWIGTVDEATSAMDEHRRIVENVVTAYESAAKSSADWAKSIKDVNLLQANANLKRMRAELDKIREKAGDEAQGALSFLNPFSAGGPEAAALNVLAKAYEKGAISARKFRDGVLEIYTTTQDPAVEEFADKLRRVAEEAITVEKNVGEAALVARELGSEAKGLADDIDRAGVSFENLSGAIDDVSDSKANEALEKFDAAIKSVTEKIPELKAEADRLEQVTALRKLIDEMRELREEGNLTAEKFTEFYDLAKKAIENVNIEAFTKQLGLQGDALGKTLSLIKRFEGFRADSYNDPRTDSQGRQVGPDIYRAGYGSSEITLSDGTIQKVTAGMKVTREDADRDLLRRVVTEFQPIAKAAAGDERWRTFTDEQKAALTSIAYNFGNIPERIAKALREGTSEDIAEAIRSYAPANGGVNEGRRDTEAAFFDQGNPQLALLMAETERKRTEEARKYNENLRERLESEAQELALKENNTRELYVQKAVEDEIRKAKKAGHELEKDIIETIRQQAGAEWDRKAAIEAENQQRKEARDLVNEVTGLEQQRRILMQEMQQAYGEGDLERVRELQKQLTEVRNRLTEIVPLAMEMAKQLGDERMVASVAKAAQGTKGLSLEVFKAKDITQDLARGVTNAFDRFAQSIAEGVKPLKALRDAFLQFAADFLRQIAQMILYQALFRALGGIGGSIAGGMNSLFPVPTAHVGGVLGHGGGGASRLVDPALFRNAMRFHDGGIPGLKANEIPIIAKKGEEVLTEDDPRHIFNGGAAGGSTNLKVVNAIDSSSVLNAALNSTEGEKVLINHIRANAESVRSALGV